MKYIQYDLSRKILYLGVSMKTKGGMASVLMSYEKYIANMQFIPTWKLGNKVVKIMFVLQAFLRTWWVCKFSKQIEIVHIHGAANASFYRCKLFINLAKKYHKKVILHEHAADFRDFYSNSADKVNIIKTINSCDCFIVLSKSWQEYFISIGVNKEKIHVLNNIVSPPIQHNVIHNDNKLHLIYLGELSQRKGIYDLLIALNEYKNYFEDRLLLKIGGNEVDCNVKKFIQEKALSGFVSYEGWVSGDKKVNNLIWADIYILPSYNEGLPVAILEAMSYSHPIISTYVGGIPEIVIPGNNGILVQPGNVKGIADAIKYYIENKDIIELEGKKSYDIVKDFFPEAVFSELISIYRTLL